MPGDWYLRWGKALCESPTFVRSAPLLAVVYRGAQNHRMRLLRPRGHCYLRNHSYAAEGMDAGRLARCTKMGEVFLHLPPFCECGLCALKVRRSFVQQCHQIMSGRRGCRCRTHHNVTRGDVAAIECHITFIVRTK